MFSTPNTTSEYQTAQKKSSSNCQSLLRAQKGPFLI
jgi:hypothetical protein